MKLRMRGVKGRFAKESAQQRLGVRLSSYDQNGENKRKSGHGRCDEA